MPQSDVALRPAGSLAGAPVPITPDIAYLRTAIVNVVFIGAPEVGDRGWILVDTGIPGAADRIAGAAERRYGVGCRPAAIILTHGHFDHVGNLRALANRWDVPIYAHRLELPYLTGRSSYPPPDPTVGGGLMARLSPLVPEKGVDLGDHVRALPANGDVPGMPGWRWIHTPGHAPGHVSLFRDSDRMLIAGDAVTTTKQESVFAVLTQNRELHGPPAYFTIDWENARRAVATLASLKPTLLAPGHGEPLRGASVPDDLAALARDFDGREKPEHGRYVHQPATTGEDGVLALPPSSRSGGVRWGMLSGVAAAAFAGTWLYRRFGRRSTS